MVFDFVGGGGSLNHFLSEKKKGGLLCVKEWLAFNIRERTMLMDERKGMRPG